MGIGPLFYLLWGVWVNWHVATPARIDLSPSEHAEVQFKLTLRI